MDLSHANEGDIRPTPYKFNGPGNNWERQSNHQTNDKWFWLYNTSKDIIFVFPTSVDIPVTNNSCIYFKLNLFLHSSQRYSYFV